jgi:hypothetical protein
MAQDILRIAPELNKLWPVFSSRTVRPTDPGPVEELKLEDLARLLDRCARFDPPQLPAPVGPWGYSIHLSGPEGRPAALGLGVSVRASCVLPDVDNRCILHLHHDCPIWRSVEVGSAMLETLVRAWEPDWALAWASLKKTAEEERSGRVGGPVRPWLSWRKGGVATIPYEFVAMERPPTIRSARGGELCIWP